MVRSSFWAATAFALFASTAALACPGGMAGMQGGGHDMHGMMHGQDMGHGQQMGQGCGQGGYCPMSGMAQADENRPAAASTQPNDAHAGHDAAAKKEEAPKK